MTIRRIDAASDNAGVTRENRNALLNSETQSPPPAPRFELLTTSEEVADLARALSGESAIAFDTESNSRHGYPEKVCLIQMATENAVYLIDTLAVDDMAPFGEILSDESTMKVAQGVEYDVRCLDREWGFRIRNLFDTSIAARFVGMERTGLSALIESLLGVTIPKLARLQKSDWARRPISDEALSYAATDVSHLLDLRTKLETELTDLGRYSWAAEEFVRTEEIRYNGQDPETAFLSMKGARKLNGRQKAVLKRLFSVREAEARRRDRPPYFVLPHEVLMQLAANPNTDLTTIPPLKRQVRSRLGRQIGAALQKGQTDPPIKNPPRRTGLPTTPITIERLQELKAWRIELGKQLSLDPALLWPMVSLERLAKAPDTLDTEFTTGDVRRWQRAEFADGLTAALG